ncbi:MAG: hypothetical protein LBL58_13815 [Tannerellaceae bacterium]|jgi:hypothetical protein|nr:hypothetical protein [Tannerellaceae bacterium]
MKEIKNNKMKENVIEQAKNQVIAYYQGFINKCLDVYGIDLHTIINDSVTAGVNLSQRWILVKEELPPIGRRVLVKDESGGVHVSYRGIKNEWYIINYTPVSWRHIEL